VWLQAVTAAQYDLSTCVHAQVVELTAANARLIAEVEELRLQTRLATEGATSATEAAKMRVLQAAKAEEAFQQKLSDSKQVKGRDQGRKPGCWGRARQARQARQA